MPSLTKNSEPPLLCFATNDFARLRARESLSGLIGEEMASQAWRAACEAAGAPENEDWNADRLEAFIRELEAQGPKAALVAHSLSIRLRSFQLLASAQRLDQFIRETP